VRPETKTSEPAAIPREPRACVRPHGGVPTLFVDGKPSPALFYATARLDRKHLRSFARAGVDLVAFAATSDYHLYGLAADVWLAPGVFDHSGFDDRVRFILDAHPRALLLPRVYVGSPPFWDEAHPGELQRYDDGAARKPLWFSPRKETAPSLASLVWRRDAEEALRRLVRHVEGSDFADRVIGYHVTSAHTEEWFHLGTQEGHLFDYSEPALRAFRAWLQAAYVSEERLRRAWGDPGAAFETAEIPGALDRLGPPEALFAASPRARPALDYHLFLSDVVADAILAFARAVKEESRRRAIVTTFYGYLVEHAFHPLSIRHGGHLALDRVLASADVDGLASPTSYALREPGDGQSLFMSATASVRRHGKLWLDENDVRTHRLPANAGYGRTSGVAETIEIQRRETAAAVTQGAGMWWFDMSGGWYDDRPTMDEIASLARLAGRAVRLDRASAAEVAFVVDGPSCAAVLGDRPMLACLLPHQLIELGRIGAPVDVILLSDVEATRPYRFYVFANAFLADRERRRRVRSAVEEARAGALFLLAPGGLDPTLDLAGIEELTTFRVRSEDVSARYVARIVDAPHPLLEGAAAHAPFGMPAAARPRLYVSDPDAAPLGRFEDDGKVALAAKSVAGAPWLYSAAPVVPERVLRNSARAAGAHLYSDLDDWIAASRSLLAVHARRDGERRFRLPRASDVVDAFTGTTVARRADGFRATLRRGETALYFVGDEAEWKAADSAR